MKITPVVARLKAQCPAFANRVAGAAALATALEQTDFPLPHAFVVREADQPSDDDVVGGTVQDCAEEFAVVLVVSNTADATGLAADDQIDDLRAAVAAALIGWRPDPDATPVIYEGGALDGFDRARLWYRLSFQTQSVLAEVIEDV